MYLPDESGSFTALSRSPNTITGGFHRAALAGLLLAAYLWAWAPVRAAWTQGAGVLLADLAPASTRVTARLSSSAVHVQPAAAPKLLYVAPVDAKFLFAGLALILLVPVRPRLGLFLSGHLALSLLLLALVAAGAAGLPGAGVLVGFVQDYVVDAYSLGVPVLMWARPRLVEQSY